MAEPPVDLLSPLALPAVGSKTRKKQAPIRDDSRTPASKPHSSSPGDVKQKHDNVGLFVAIVRGRTARIANF
jgi:hypothetical protein